MTRPDLHILKDETLKSILLNMYMNMGFIMLKKVRLQFCLTIVSSVDGRAA